MNNPHMSGQRVVPAECLLLGTKMTADFLLAPIVYRIFMPGKIIRPRENGIARLAGRWVDAVAFVRSGLRIP